MRVRLPERWYRDAWLLAITVVVLFAVKAINHKTNEIQQGRKATAEITCAISAAVVKAGRLTIVTSAEAPLPPKLDQFLQRYGYPSPSARKTAAEVTAADYTRAINEEVIRAVGAKAKDVLEPNLIHGKSNPRGGSLNCEKLRDVAHLP